MEFRDSASADPFQEKTMSKIKKAPAPFFKEKKDFIKKFVKADSINWGREIKIINTLWNKYPEPSFWATFALTFQLNSLAWLMGEGQPELTRQWNYFKLDKQQQKPIIAYVETPVPTELKTFKPRSMADWIKQSKSTN